MTPTETSIGLQVATGTSWTIAMRLAIRGLGLVSMILLARLLVPEDFGLVALASMLVAFIEVASQFRFDIYIIRAKDPERTVYDTVWTLSILRGLAMAGILILIAAPAASLLDEPRLELIIYVIAPLLVLDGFRNVAVVDFQKYFDFSKDFSFLVAIKLFSFFATIVAALALRNYWALVIGLFTAGVVGLVFSFAMHPFRPRFCFSGAGKILGFSKWLVLRSILDFTINNGDIFLIGKLAGPAILGIYTVAREISTLATSELLMPIRRVMLPGFSKLDGDRVRLRDAYIGAQAVVNAIGCPVAVGIWLIADPAIRVLLGLKWLDAIPLVQVIALYGLVEIISTNSGPVFIALSRPKLVVVSQVVRVTVLLPLLFWSIREWGAIGAAWSVTAAAVVALTVTLALLQRVVDIGVVATFRASARTFAATAAMIGIVLLARSMFAETVASLPAFLHLMVTVVLGATTYGGMHLLLWHLSGLPNGPERKILQLMPQLFRKLSGKATGPV